MDRGTTLEFQMGSGLYIVMAAQPRLTSKVLQRPGQFLQNGSFLIFHRGREEICTLLL